MRGPGANRLPVIRKPAVKTNAPTPGSVNGSVNTPRPDRPPRHSPESTDSVTTSLVTTTGSIGVGTKLVGVGRAHAGKTATVFRTGDLVTVFIDDRCARELIIDHTKRYQPQHR